MAKKPSSKAGKVKARKPGAAGESAAAIAERAMPGWKAVAPSGPLRAFGATSEAADTVVKPKVDAVMPSMAELHRKYYGDAASDAAADAAPEKPLEDGLEVVEMRSGDLRKAVGVNRRSKKVEWSQG